MGCIKLYGVYEVLWSVMECYGEKKKVQHSNQSVSTIGQQWGYSGVEWGGPYRSQACNRTACCVCASVIALACSWIALHASVTCGQK